jgi:hypothetical protein
MNDRMKMNMEELKKSFPSVDDFSTKKLLGGNGPIIGFNEHDLSPVYGEPLSDPNPGGNPSGSGPNSGGPSGGPNSGGHPTASDAAWASYFGDSGMDWGNDGFGGSDWGDGGSGGDSNPGGSEGGNGQNSSGNPGGQGQQGELPWLNNSTPTSQPYTVQNNTNATIYAKPENNFPAGTPNFISIPPDGTINTGIDGLQINGIVYKFVNGYGWVQVNAGNYTTNYSTGGSIIQYWGGGVLDTPPDPTWQDLFDAP